MAQYGKSGKPMFGGKPPKKKPVKNKPAVSGYQTLAERMLAGANA